MSAISLGDSSPRKLVHTMQMPLRWGDMDAMGHVNNTVYFRYFEQARVEWFHSFGCEFGSDGEGPVIVNAHCSFMRQLKYPADIEVRTFAGPPGRSSFDTWMEIRRVHEPNVLIAQGGAKVVWVSVSEEKSRPLPERIRAMLSSD